MILVIYAHPSREGHCGAILEEVKTRLSANKLEHEILDLYEAGYDPIMKKDELYTHGGTESEETKAMQEKIKTAEKLIFIYPVWWNTMPAMLKGFIDKTFTPEFAYKFSDKRLPIQLLKDKKASIFITTGASKAAFWFFLGSRGEKVMAKDILGFCGVKTKAFHLDNARHLDDATREKIKSLVTKGLHHALS
ncbi:NAD(P)H-dependent oxidoreductase [Candidatus Woesearchaeota archaeon]|nr:NAD(P)H-dependent oxidoreductase [Candidatus Woesearchaeota archaeon]